MLRVLGAILSSLERYLLPQLCPRLVFPQWMVACPQCRRDQCKPGDREPAANPGLLAGGLEVVLMVWRWSCWDGGGPAAMEVVLLDGHGLDASFQRGEWDQESRRGLDTFSLPVIHEK